MLILTDTNFDEEIKKAAVPVLVDTYADWCGPCKLMAPVLDELEREYAGKIVVGKLDVDANFQTASKFGVMSIPTTIFLKDGKEVKRVVGYQGKGPLVNAVNEVIGK